MFKENSFIIQMDGFHDKNSDLEEEDDDDEEEEGGGEEDEDDSLSQCSNNNDEITSSLVNTNNTTTFYGHNQLQILRLIKNQKDKIENLERKLYLATHQLIHLRAYFSNPFSIYTNSPNEDEMESFHLPKSDSTLCFPNEISTKSMETNNSLLYSSSQGLNRLSHQTLMRVQKSLSSRFSLKSLRWYLPHFRSTPRLHPKTVIIIYLTVLHVYILFHFIH